MIVVRFLQFLFVLLVVRLIGRALAAMLSGRAAAPPRPNARVSGGELVRDRVCNTHIPRDKAVVARIDGREAFFCSTACRDVALGSVTRAS